MKLLAHFGCRMMGFAYVLIPIESLLWEVIALGVGKDIFNQDWEDRLELLEGSGFAHLDG